MGSLVAQNLDLGVHPFVVHIIGFAFVGEEPCLISPSMGEEEVQNYLGSRPEADRVALVCLPRYFAHLPSALTYTQVQDITEGMTHLHNCGIVHSDLRPVCWLFAYFEL